MLPQKICITSIWTPNQQELATITVSNKVHYCKHRNYSGAFLLKTSPFSIWDMVFSINGLLESNLYQYIMWCDNDTLFTNFHKRIEDLIDDQSDFFICTDESKQFNAGVYIIKNSPSGIDFWKHIQERMKTVVSRYYLGEFQTSIIDLSKEISPRVIKVLPQKAMNSQPQTSIRGHKQGLPDALGTNGDWEKGDLLLHIPGFGSDYYDRLVKHMQDFDKEVIK
jgi:hypothetical protein